MHRLLNFGALVFAGCIPALYPATTGYNNACQTWVNDSVSHLIGTWGRPTQVTPLPDGTQMYEWDQVNGATLSQWRRGEFQHIQTAGNQPWCATRFTVSASGIVQSFGWNGWNVGNGDGTTSYGCSNAPLGPSVSAPVAGVAPAPVGVAPAPVGESPIYASEPAGIGAEITARSDGANVIQLVMPGSPAQAAGLAAGDIFVAVDGASVQGMTVQMVTARVRGVAGTTVSVTVVRNGQPLTVTCQRRTL